MTISYRTVGGFSALQRAEIAEMLLTTGAGCGRVGFSALQRAEIAEIYVVNYLRAVKYARFSALQRAEIAEIINKLPGINSYSHVSVLFNEPKLLK